MKKIFAVYKPKGISSYDVIREIKKCVRNEKIGHAGTLDPLAEGVLVIAVGREATRSIAEEVQKEKEYTATIRFGMESTTDDEEGEKTIFHSSYIPALDEVQKVTQEFVGEIMQTPPIYSAIKNKGKEAYKYAREGKEVILESRKILIKNITVVEYVWPILKIKVTTGPGVYIRALARDIGKKLGVGGYLTGLIRTRVGEYGQENAVSFTELGKMSYMEV